MEIVCRSFAVFLPIKTIVPYGPRVNFIANKVCYKPIFCLMYFFDRTHFTVVVVFLIFVAVTPKNWRRYGDYFFVRKLLPTFT